MSEAPEQPVNGGEIVSREQSIFDARIEGRSISSIAREHGCSVEEVRSIIASQCSSIDMQARQEALVIELTRLDQLHQTFFNRAKGVRASHDVSF